MRFLVDAQLPPALARWLAERGHVYDIGLHAADDRVLWDYAVSGGAVIITRTKTSLSGGASGRWPADCLGAPR